MIIIPGGKEMGLISELWGFMKVKRSSGYYQL